MIVWDLNYRSGLGKIEGLKEAETGKKCRLCVNHEFKICALIHSGDCQDVSDILL